MCAFQAGADTWLDTTDCYYQYIDQKRGERKGLFISSDHLILQKPVLNKVIRETQKDITYNLCKYGLIYFAAQIEKCYQNPNQKITLYQKCIFQDYVIQDAYWSFLNQTITQGDFSIKKVDEREQKYILPQFKTKLNASYYFGDAPLMLALGASKCVQYKGND